MSHACAIPGCERPAKPNQLMCWPHWRRVPRALNRAVLEAAQDEAARYGATAEIVITGRHPKIKLIAGDRVRVFPFAGTPRTPEHSPVHTRQRIRQKLREMGIERVEPD